MDNVKQIWGYTKQPWHCLKQVWGLTLILIGLHTPGMALPKTGMDGSTQNMS